MVVENEKGTVVKTAFAYQVSADDVNENVDVNAGTVTYAPTIDLTAVDAKTEKPVSSMQMNTKVKLL